MSLTTAQVFGQIAALAGEDVFQNALPVVTSTLSSIQSNPGQWTNPLSAGLLANKFLVDLLATVPALEQSAVQGAATLVNSVLTAVSSKFASTSTSLTPASVGAELGAAAAAAIPSAAPVLTSPVPGAAPTA